VKVTTDGGCMIHVPTPAAVDIPPKPCRKLAIRVRPQRLRAGHRTRVRVTVRPAVAGTIVRSGRRRARTNAGGVAHVRVCAPTKRGVAISATAPGFLPARAALRARGHARRC
jgi:hypothetical protein